MPRPAPPAGSRTRLAVEHLDDRLNPAAPTLLNPTPLTLSGAGSVWDYSAGGSFTPSPVFANVDGQAGDELLTVTGSRKVAAYKWGGRDGNGNPVFTLLRTYDPGANGPELHTTPLVVTLPGVGPAVFAGGLDGRVFGWNAATGAALPGWPSSVDVPDGLYPLGSQPNYILGPLAAGDLDGDGVPEIVATSYNQQVTALRADGSVMWRYANDDSVLSGAAIGDLDRDGRNEVVFGGDASQNAYYDAGGNVTALSGDGRRKWVKHINQIGQSSPVLADVNGDGKLEVFTGTGINYANLNGVAFPGNAVYGLDSEGNDLPGWPYVTGPSSRDFRTPAPPAVADLDGDGQFEVVIGDGAGQIHAVNADGTPRWKVQAFPAPLYAAPAVADVTGDGKLDVVQVSNSEVKAYDGATGALSWAGFIDNGNLAQYVNSPAVGNFKGDGTTQLAILSNGPSGANGQPTAPSALRLFDLPATAAAPAWTAARGNAAANGVARPAAFATDYATALAAYLGRDAAGAAALARDYRDGFRAAQNLTPLTQAVVGSVEGRSREIRSWYTRYLDRAADQAGVNSWLGVLNQGYNFAQAQGLLLGSPESFQKSGPNGPASATNQTWAVYLYQRVLGRTPQGGEEAFWVNGLNGGLQTRDVALGFLLSQEYTQNLVRKWYATYRLGGTTPAADTLAAAAWDLRRGVTEETVLVRLFTQGLTAATSDYLVTHPEGSWLRALYQDVLGRPASAADAVHWLRGFEGGLNYSAVANAIVRSPERHALIVQGYFARYLRRGTPPSAAEIAPFVARLNGGERREGVVASILGSQEYYNRAGGTTDGFVAAAYGDLLAPGRQADPTALAYWRSRPNVRGELPPAVMQTDEYCYNTIRAWFFADLRRYPDTPSNQSVLANATLPGADAFAPVRALIEYMKAGGQQSDVELAILTSPEYLAVARNRAFWTGTRWRV